MIKLSEHPDQTSATLANDLPCHRPNARQHASRADPPAPATRYRGGLTLELVHTPLLQAHALCDTGRLVAQRHEEM